jgi:hypothetical protein
MALRMQIMKYGRQGQHAFTIHPHLEVCDDPCWQLKKYQGVDMKFLSVTLNA